MIRSHLLYAGDIYSEVMRGRQTFCPLEIDISMIKDAGPDNWDGESDFVAEKSPDLVYPSEYKLLGATDGKRFNLGAVFKEDHCFLQEDIEALEEKADRLFERFRAEGWDIQVKSERFSKADWTKRIKGLEKIEEELKKRYSLSSKEEEDLYVKIPKIREGLKRLLEEGRYDLRIFVNCDKDGNLQTLVKVPKQVPGRFFGKKTVYETEIRAFRFRDRDDILDRFSEFGNLIAEIVAFYHQLAGHPVDDDIFLHMKYKEPMKLKKPFKEYIRGRRSTFVFEADPDGKGLCHDTMKAYKENQQGVVIPVKRKPRPIKIELPTADKKQLSINGHDTPLHQRLNITKKKIKEALGAYVVGQERAKDALAAAAYKHYARIYQSSDDGVQIKKSNVLFYGPTGSGKTHLLQSLAKILDVPLIIADASNLTAPGYVGEDTSEMIEMLVSEANGDRERAQMGIVYIDEIDKLASLGDRATVKTTQVQYNLLKLIEGKVVKTKKGPIDTSNILFVCGGAFAGDPSSGIPGLEERVRERLTDEERELIGFVSRMAEAESKQGIDYHKLMQHVETEDLRAYGLIPELIGRLQTMVGLNRLSLDELRMIIVEPNSSSLDQAVKLFSQENIELVFEDSAMDYVADVAHKHNTGARAIESTMNKITNALLDRVGSDEKKIVVTKELAKAIVE